ncbi:MAG: 3-keto-5-aminohexanoate cleavage protein [Lachnospiraceae bacterium]
MKKIIISLAPVAASTSIDADLLAADVAKSVLLGAGMCHLHCRKEDGTLTPDTSFLITCFEKILAKTDVVIQASTGGVSDLTIEQRCAPLTYTKVESASLNGGSTNLGEAIYHNSFSDIRYCAQAVYDHQIIPEIEVFDIGMIHNIELTAGEQPFRNPIIYNLVFGHKGGMQPTIEGLTAFRSFVPKDALWGVTHFGRDNWDFLAAAIAMGDSIVRIGFEDSPYVNASHMATHNYEVVDKLANLIRAMDFETATPEEAREIMHICPTLF